MELNEQELTELKSVLAQISTRIPENKAGYVWNTFNQIRGEREPQPCMCASSAKHWVRAVEALRNYVSNK
jgi:hypothetical protein